MTNLPSSRVSPVASDSLDRLDSVDFGSAYSSSSDDQQRRHAPTPVWRRSRARPQVVRTEGAKSDVSAESTRSESSGFSWLWGAKTSGHLGDESDDDEAAGLSDNPGTGYRERHSLNRAVSPTDPRVHLTSTRLDGLRSGSCSPWYSP